MDYAYNSSLGWEPDHYTFCYNYNFETESGFSDWTSLNGFSILVEEGHKGDIYINAYSSSKTSPALVLGEPKYTFNINVATNDASLGTVSKNKSSVTEGGSVTLTATETSGTFQGWSLDGGTTIIAGTNNQLTYSPTLGADAGSDGQTFTYTAVFVPKTAPQYTITVQADNDDYCTVSGGGTYFAGTNVTISSASKNEHLYIFDRFVLEGEDEDQGAPSFNITVTGDATYTAYYRLANSGTITAATNNASYGTASASLTGSQPGGTAVTLTATPYGGYAFAGWDDNNDGTVDNTDNPRTVYVDGDKEYVAKFIVETASYASFSFDNPNDNIQIDKYTEPAVQCQTSFYPYGISLVEIIAKNTTRTSKNYLQMYIKTNNFRTYYPEGGSSYQGPAYGTYSVSVPSEYGPVIGNCDNSIYESNYYFVYTGDVTDVVIGYKVETASHGGTCHFQGYEGTLAQRLCSFSSYGADYSNETKSNFATFNNGTITVAEGAGGHPYITIRIGGTLVASIGAPAQPYTLTWDANGGELSGTYTAAGSVNEGTSITAPTATRTGYTFTGWSPAFTGTMPSANTTYTAQWTPNTYTVTFAANGGSGTMADQAFTYGTAQNLRANTFTGPAATITYDYNGATGGIGVASETVNATFGGWLDGSSNYYDDEQNVNNLTATNGATITMTAQWDWLEEITLPSPTKTGYTFNDWNGTCGGMGLTGQAGEAFMVPEGGGTLTAQWNIVNYTITYNGLEGATNAGNPTSYNVETATITLADPGVRDGYVFAGWKDESDNTITQIAQGSTGDRTLTATWTAATTLDIYDNQDATYYNNIKTLNGQTYDVTYHRSVKYESDGGNARWYTLCLPFDVDQSQLTNAGLLRKVYEYRYATGSADVGDQVTFHFRVATSMVAGQGYLVKATGDMGPNFTFTGVTLNTSADVEDGNVDNLKNSNAYKESGNIAIVGVLRSGTLSNDGRKVMGLANNKIWYPHSSGNPMPAYRAYFYNPNASASVMPRVRIVVEGEDTTELEVVDGELYDAGGDDRAPRKYICNGVLIIERNGIRYDAQGKRL
ncbi:MAG: InlB B-repeat-containing protein [Paludibacteraceae bacterium]|nr:InlB B-repeat-containing protein [Paludibacteraceae bacterium]